MRSPLRRILNRAALALAATAPLLFSAPAAEAGDWRRHHYGSPGVVILPGITLQFDRRYAAPPRYRHDRRSQWHQPYGWHERRHFDRQRHGRQQRPWRHDRRRWHH